MLQAESKANSKELMVFAAKQAVSDPGSGTEQQSPAAQLPLAVCRTQGRAKCPQGALTPRDGGGSGAQSRYCRGSAVGCWSSARGDLLCGEQRGRGQLLPTGKRKGLRVSWV